MYYLFLTNYFKYVLKIDKNNRENFGADCKRNLRVKVTRSR